MPTPDTFATRLQKFFWNNKPDVAPMAATPLRATATLRRQAAKKISKGQDRKKVMRELQASTALKPAAVLEAAEAVGFGGSGYSGGVANRLGAASNPGFVRRPKQFAKLAKSEDQPRDERGRFVGMGAGVALGLGSTVAAPFSDRIRYGRGVAGERNKTAAALRRSATDRHAFVKEARAKRDAIVSSEKSWGELHNDARRAAHGEAIVRGATPQQARAAADAASQAVRNRYRSEPIVSVRGQPGKFIRLETDTKAALGATRSLKTDVAQYLRRTSAQMAASRRFNIMAALGRVAAGSAIVGQAGAWLSSK